MAEAAVTTRLKKLINTPETEVKDALAGMVAAHGDLIRVEYDPNVIIRKDAPRKGKVGLVSGGGSGHEPMHGGYVGLGMLDAACPGAVFTSPTPDQMARAAEAGADLETVTTLAKKVNANGRSMGMALTSCIVPAAGKVTFEIADDEMELGIGIHGEPGRERTKLKSADEIAEILTSTVVKDLPYKRGDEVLAFVNGMGGTPLIELYVVANAVNRYLQKEGIKPARWLVGSYITSLEMAGCSVTLLKLDAETTKFWDAPVHTPALRWGV